MNKIIIATGGSIPSYYAHSFNVMKMAQGFTMLGYETEIVTASNLYVWYQKFKIKKLYEHYGITNKIPIKWLYPSLFAFFISRTSNDYRYCKNASEYIRKMNPDIVLCRNYLIPYFLVKMNIPTVMETHSTNYDLPHLKKILEVANLSSFKALVTIHENIKEEYIKRGVPRDKIIVLEDGVDLERFEILDDKLYWREKLGLCKQKKYIIYAGHLYPEKGIEIVLQIAKKLKERVDLNFLMLGGFERDRRYWEKYCEIHNIPNVEFKGFIANKLIPQYLKAADCLLLPYKLDIKFQVMDINTTSPLKLFEYMAAKRPIVAANIPTIAKILAHNKNALLVEPNDISSYCSAIKLVVDDSFLSNSLGANALSRVQEYTWDKRCLAIINFITKN